MAERKAAKKNPRQAHSRGKSASARKRLTPRREMRGPEGEIALGLDAPDIAPLAAAVAAED